MWLSYDTSFLILLNLLPAFAASLALVAANSSIYCPISYYPSLNGDSLDQV